ncbi:MAG: hypothetical protein N2443_00505 [Blastocatellia bacterium]|nr:hypothetical protein [Blastocatellia bacterium]MDW8169039.1 hypothetical protein [Acidobacteriota bacterium]MDW8256399.1 hypothetical protein [Acidobacteriota bacterium]
MRRQKAQERHVPLMTAVIGVPFYTREEFQKQQQYAEDRFSYESYDHWMRSHRELRRKLEALGIIVIEVPINVEEMQQYFLQHGLRNDAANRSQYVARKLFEQRDLVSPVLR